MPAWGTDKHVEETLPDGHTFTSPFEFWDSSDCSSLVLARRMGMPGLRCAMLRTRVVLLPFRAKGGRPGHDERFLSSHHSPSDCLIQALGRGSNKQISQTVRGLLARCAYIKAVKT